MNEVKLKVWETGGGCTALRGEIPGTDMFVLITQDMDHVLDPRLPIEVGIYQSGKDDDVCLGYFELNVETLQ